MRHPFILLLLSIAMLFCNVQLDAHDGHNHESGSVPVWELRNGTLVTASFLMNQGDCINLEKDDHSVVQFPLSDFSGKSRQILQERIDIIQSINADIRTSLPKDSGTPNSYPWLAVIVTGILGLAVSLTANRLKRGLFGLMLLSGLIALMAFNKGSVFMVSGTDPEEMDKAFEPFKPAINTFWDANYFYVESHGIPDHEMMTGIVKWQQQVPLPQCYTGSNAWPIPLNPQIAATPVPVNQEHFLRGAVAVAANGVPIFNPYTNTGIDALVDGQLDNFGGHSGRADDYHYHIAPLHLDTITEAVLPIAYALDGFAIYGPKEPDGSAMKPLDENHGHFGSNGIYHYHGTKEKPYMIGRMVGKVTEDNTMQIVPQAAAKGVRPALTPLNGAVITDCTPNAAQNGYKLTYQRSGQTYMVDYSWTNAGKYTYNFIGPSGTTTSVYNGFIPCSITSAVEDSPSKDVSFEIVPNPSGSECIVRGLDASALSSLRSIALFNIRGRKVYEQLNPGPQFPVAGLPEGMYLVQLTFNNYQLTKKIVVH
jgi:hypothetical protein